MATNLRSTLSAEGVLILRDICSADQVATNLASYGHINQELQSLRGLAVGVGDVLTPSGMIASSWDSEFAVWAKVERTVVASHGFASLARWLTDVVSNIAGESYVLFKDKINVKMPGLRGFGPHQDFESYRHYVPRFHLTAMVSLVPTTEENGCLYFASEYETSLTPDDVHEDVGDRKLLRYEQAGASRGDLLSTIDRKLVWRPTETSLADIAIFDSFVPHFSSANRTTNPRPTLFLTYSRLREGDWYGDYYERKLRALRTPQ